MVGVACTWLRLQQPDGLFFLGGSGEYLGTNHF